MSRKDGRRADKPLRATGFLKLAAILSVLHLVIAAGSFVLGFSIGIKRWDSGPPGMLESTATAIGEVLLQPGSGLLRVGMPGEVEWAIILGNSVLWGIAGAMLVRAIVKARRGRAA